MISERHDPVNSSRFINPRFCRGPELKPLIF